MYTHLFSFRFFFHIDYHKILGRVLCVIQLVPIGQSFIPQRAYANLKFPVHSSSPDLSPLVTINFSKPLSRYLFCKHHCILVPLCFLHMYSFSGSLSEAWSIKLGAPCLVLACPSWSCRPSVTLPCVVTLWPGALRWL